MSINDLLGNKARDVEIYPTREEYRNFVLGQWNTVISDQGLSEILQAYGLDGCIDPPDAPQRIARRNLMQRAQEKWTEVLCNSSFDPDLNHSVCNDGHRFDRALQAFLEDSPTADTPQRNREALAVFLGDDKRAKTELVTRRLTEACDIVDHAYELTDEQLIDNFETIRNACRLPFEASHLESARNDLDFSDGFGELCKDIKERYETKASSILHRLKNIGNPFYEKVAPQALKDFDFPLLMDPENTERRNKQLQGDSHFLDYAMNTYQNVLCGQTQARKDRERRERVNFLPDYFAAYYDYPEQIQIFSTVDGRALGNGQRMDTTELLKGKPVMAKLPGGEMRVFYLEEQDGKLGVAVDTVEGFFNDNIETQIKELSNGLSDTELLFRGSDAFKNMKKAFQTFQKDFQPLQDIPTEEAYKSLESQLKALEATAHSYLDYKGAGPHKEGVETSRVELAQKMERFAKQKLNHLKLMKDAGQKECVLDDAQMDAEKHRAQEKIGDLEFNYYRGLREEIFLRDSEAETLYRSVLRNLQKDETKQLLSAGEFSKDQEKRARHSIARMVSIDLILKERSGNPNAEAGVMEQALNEMGTERFVDSIENSNIFRTLTSSMTPEVYTQFLSREGQQQFTDRLLERVRARKPQEPQAEAQRNPIINGPVL